MKPNPRRTNSTQRNTLRNKILAEENHCWICGNPVDKTLKTPHPGSPEIDEIIPITKGGSPYKRDNCRLAHRQCNRQRGNGDKRRRYIEPLTTTRTL